MTIYSFTWEVKCRFKKKAKLKYKSIFMILHVSLKLRETKITIVHRESTIKLKL